jgi:hypothetical protein
VAGSSREPSHISTPLDLAHDCLWALRCEFELLPPGLIAIEVLNLPSVTGYILRIRSREPGMPFQRVRLIDTFAATGLKFDADFEGSQGYCTGRSRRHTLG